MFLSFSVTHNEFNEVSQHIIVFSIFLYFMRFIDFFGQVNGCLSYFDKIPDGFYSIHGMDPYIWAVCSDLQESGRIPSLESLKAVDPAAVSSVEVISVDRRGDPSLRELQNRIHTVSSSSISTKEVVDHLAKLVCDHMG